MIIYHYIAHTSGLECADMILRYSAANPNPSAILLASPDRSCKSVSTLATVNPVLRTKLRTVSNDGCFSAGDKGLVSRDI